MIGKNACRGLVAAFCAAVMTVTLGAVSAAAATADDVRAFMEHYAASYDTGNSREIAAHYGAPFWMLAPNGDLRAYQTADEVQSTVRRWKRWLKYNGYDHTKWVELNIKALSDNTAVVSAVWDRVREGGSVLQRGSATYTLHNPGGNGWKIFLVHVHTPEAVMHFTN